MNVTRLFTRNLTVEALISVRSATVRAHRDFADLGANVVRLSNALERLGVCAGDRVLVLCGSRIESVESLLATMHLGAVAVPMNLLAGKANLLSTVESVAPRCCIFEETPDPALRNALETRGTIMIAVRRPDAASPSTWIHYDRLLEAGSAAAMTADFPDAHPALIVHGSGSSGELKAIVMGHGALLRFFEYHNFVWSQYSDRADTFEATSPVLTALPLSHLAGMALCFQGLMSGRRTYLLSQFVSGLYLKVLEEARCSAIFLVPSLYRAVLKDPYLRTMDKSALRFCVTGGEPCPEALAEEIEESFGVPLVTAYSMTECLSGIGHSRRELFARDVKRSSCGRQLFGEVKLCDRDGVEQPVEGELWVRNATVHRCYLQPHLNESRFHDGWYRSGDLFYRDEDGDFFHRGRADDMFICNGKNLYPLELETLLTRHAAVDAVCAAPVTTADKRIVPAVLVVGRDSLSESEVQEFCSRLAPSHAIPQVVRLVTALPTLSTGKMDRKRAAQWLQEAYDAEAAGLRSPV